MDPLSNLLFENFANLFGTSPERIKETAGDLIDGLDLGYTIIDGFERDNLILSILKKINSPELKNAGSHRENDWEDGWRENLNDLIQSKYDLKALIPKYYKKNVNIRLNREYVLPSHPDFVYQYTRIFRAWLFQEYLTNFDVIYEFGCGTGHNLVHLAELFPQKRLYGFDWATSSEDIIHILAQQCNINVSGGKFNFFEPDENIILEDKSAVFTFGALEQIGENHNKYLDFIMSKKPSLCVDVTCLHEHYDETQLIDYLALIYHKRRNYLNGYLSRLRELETKGKVKIINTHHQLFGNLYDDPYSYVIWRPR